MNAQNSSETSIESGAEVSSTTRVSDVTNALLETGVLIGVCGVSGAGKTVFMTCVYQTAGTVLSDSAKFTASSQKSEGALYFRQVEESIRSKGVPAGTRDNVFASFSLDLVEPIPEIGSRDIPIYLFDFAGGNFELLADRKTVLAQGPPPAQRQQFEDVHWFIENCDGLIILVSSTFFEESQLASKTIPFPKVVENLVDRSARTKSPVALVFTQSDNNPRLTEQALGEFPTVKRFRSRFTNDPNSKDKPFGIVRLLTCYEIDKKSLRPKKQDAEGGIWKHEALDVFVAIVKAAWPSAIVRLQTAERMKQFQARRKTEEREKKSRREVQRQRNRTLLCGLGILLLIATMLVLSLVFRHKSQRDELATQIAFVEDIAQSLERDKLDALEASKIERLREISPRLAKENPQTLIDFWGVYQKRVSSFLEEQVVQSSSYRQKLQAYSDFASIPSPPPVWLKEASPRLRLRNEFFKAWSQLPPSADSARNRLLLLRKGEAEARNLRDEEFRSFAQQLAVQEMAVVFSQWRDEVLLKSVLSERLGLVRSFLGSISAYDHPEFNRLARETLSELVAVSVMRLEDEGHARTILNLLLPAVEEDFAGYSLPYLVIYQRLEKRMSEEAYSSTHLAQQASAAVVEYRRKTENHMHAVNSILTEIFQGAAPSDRALIAEHLLEVVRKNYLFDLSSKAWPPDVRPAVADLEVKIGWEAVVGTISMEPIYSREVEGLISVVHRFMITAQ